MLSSTSGARAQRRAFAAIVFLAAMLVGESGRGEMHSSAQEFLKEDWRQAPRVVAKATDGSGDKARALPVAIGPLPVPGRFLKVETLPFDSIPQVMGPSRESHPAWPAAEGFPGRCYMSSQPGDATALLFVWGTSGLAQCISVFKSRGLLAPGVECAPSDTVHAGLLTPEGLRLGMTRAEVETMLGAPGGSAANRIGYARRMTLPATKRLLRALGRRPEPGVKTVLRHQQVMVWFEADRVTGFSVEQNTHYD